MSTAVRKNEVPCTRVTMLSWTEYPAVAAVSLVAAVTDEPGRWTTRGRRVHAFPSAKSGAAARARTDTVASVSRFMSCFLLSRLRPDRTLANTGPASDPRNAGVSPGRSVLFPIIRVLRPEQAHRPASEQSVRSVTLRGRVHARRRPHSDGRALFCRGLLEDRRRLRPRRIRLRRRRHRPRLRAVL